jgi:hypothetical protein
MDLAQDILELLSQLSHSLPPPTHRHNKDTQALNSENTSNLDTMSPPVPIAVTIHISSRRVMDMGMVFIIMVMDMVAMPIMITIPNTMILIVIARTTMKVCITITPVT